MFFFIRITGLLVYSNPYYMEFCDCISAFIQIFLCQLLFTSSRTYFFRYLFLFLQHFQLDEKARVNLVVREQKHSEFNLILDIKSIYQINKNLLGSR